MLLPVLLLLLLLVGILDQLRNVTTSQVVEDSWAVGAKRLAWFHWWSDLTVCG